MYFKICSLNRNGKKWKGQFVDVLPIFQCHIIYIQIANVFMIIKYSFRKVMGNKLEVNYQTDSRQNLRVKKNVPRIRGQVKNNLSSISSLFNSPPLSQVKQIRLSSLRGNLNAPQCFYTLSTLIQQYYSLFKLYKKVVVCDSLCLVNQFGEIKVNFCIDEPETLLTSNIQVTHSFITAISQIISLVERLAIDKDELQRGECLHFRRHLIDKIHHFHQNDELIYREIIHLLIDFLQTNNIKCNLIDAYLRYWKYAFFQEKSEVTNQEQTPYLANSRITQRYKNSQTSKAMSYAHHEAGSPIKRNEDTITRQSHMGQDRKYNVFSKNQSKYRHKVVKTEGEEYYTAMSKRNQSINPSSLFEEITNQRFQRPVMKKIAHQYTLNILNSKPQGYEQKTLKPNSKGAISLKAVNKVQFRRETSLNGFTEVQFDHKSSACKSYAKSMLEHMARSVSIRDEPTSRDQIN